MKDETDALTQYQNAAKALQNYDSKGVALFWDACSKMSTKHCLLAEALKVYRMVVKMHMDAGRFNQAAKDWKGQYEWGMVSFRSLHDDVTVT